MTTSQHSPDTTDNSNASVSVSAAATEDAKQISLNVRTLDHTTYSISICSDASVPQLKELVAEETGVVFARQRLIFRGKVLKNDQNISAYALEDGHTLHLVARTEAAVAASAANGTSSSSDTSNGETATTSTAATTGAAPRNNDEPDPTIGTSTSMPTNHVLMGATITVPEGSDVNMPFLSSMIANIMNSVHGSMAGGNIIISEAGDPHAAANGNGATGARERGAAPMAHFVRAGAASAHAGGRLRARRSRAEPSLRSLGGGSSSSRSRSSSSAAGGSLNHGLATLRLRSETLMETIRLNMENADFDFAGLENVQLDAASGSDTAFLQSQLTQLGILLDHFRTRVQLLPAALEARATSAGAVVSSSQPRPSVAAIVRTVDTLQTIGELADLLARMGRFIFIRHNSGAAGVGATIRVRDGTSVATAGATAGLATATESNSTSRPSGSGRRQNSSSSSRGRHATTTGTQGDTAAQGADDGERARGNVLFSLLERMNESIRGATAGWTGRTENVSSSEPVANAPTSSDQPSAANTTTATQQPEGGVHHLPQISIADLGAPMASVVFPISFADLNANTTTTWNFAELVSRLSGELPASTLFGIVSGDPVSIHQVMAQIGYAIVSGVDMPPVSRATIRTWSHTLVIELRQQLRSHGIPASILSEITEPQRQSGFIDQLLRPLEPFIPDLVDHFLRATSASRTVAFGSSSMDFLQTMSRQFVRHLQAYLSGNGADEDAAVDRLMRVLRNLLVYLGLDTRVAAFAVDNFVEWVGGNNRRRRPLEADGTESGPANKRQREEQS
ncbi:Secreted rxlr effector peptide protein, partial [Globisporangium splendens]